MQRYKSHTFIPYDVCGEYELIIEINNEDDTLKSWLRWKNGMVTRYLIGLPVQSAWGKDSPLTLDQFVYIALTEIVSYVMPPCLDSEWRYAARWRDGVSPLPEGWKKLRGLLNKYNGHGGDDPGESTLEINHISQQILGYECRDYIIIVAYDEKTDRFRGWLSTPKSVFQFLCFDAPREQDGQILTHSRVASLIEAEMDTNRHIQIVKGLLRENRK